jgi:hypothetical protein
LDDDDVVDGDSDGDNVADDDAGEESMPDDMAVAPKMNTFRVAGSGIVGAVGGAKTKAGRNCATG